MSDARPGIRRQSSGRGFTYVGLDGARVRDRATLRRIRALAIPPAWTDVWIAPAANGHIQATGRDARGRKQYRYHPRWRDVRDATKYGRMIEFGEALPRVRSRINDDLARTGIPRAKVLATIVLLLEITFMRVGNEEYARQNHSFGLTTLRARHVAIDGSILRFRFRGKSGRLHEITVSDRRLARLVRQIRELPGQDLFQYLDESGEPHAIDSSDVNEYLRDVSGQDFTAKDFRTWAGSLLAARELVQRAARGVPLEKADEVAAVTAVAQRLGNTVAVCRKCYIHPAVLLAFVDREALDRWNACAGAECPAGMEEEEAVLLRYLK